MDLRVPLNDLTKPEELQKLVGALSEMAEQLDVMYVETPPNGVISARQGKVALYKNGSEYEQWQNLDGGTLWQRMNSADFVSGDWILSSVTTARTGWTDVSATYSNKFMRINATPKSTGGADTHTHAAGTFAGASHTHGAGTLSAASHTHSLPRDGWGTSINSQDSGRIVTTGAGGNERAATQDNTSGTPSSQSITGDTAADGTGTITGTSAAGDNVPAYVTVSIFEKD